MASTRPFALLRTRDQWLRCAHSRTALDDTSAFVELAWKSESSATPGTAPASPPAGLAFDSWCRLYHSVPDQGLVERILWAARDPFAPSKNDATRVAIIADDSPVVLGDFAPAAPPVGALDSPRGLAVDAHDRLYVAAWGNGVVYVYDLGNRRLIRTIRLAPEGSSGPRPLDLAAFGDAVYAVTESPSQLLKLSVGSPPVAVPIPAGVTPTRVAVSPAGRIALLDPAARKVWLLDSPSPRVLAIDPQATDLEFETETVLVVAFWPGQDFARLPLEDNPLARPGLKARGYDGLGIARTPDGRIGFFTALGFRNAVELRLRYEKTGTVSTFRLDSGAWQTTWGRLFLDACIPDGTEVRIHCVTADEVPEEATLRRTPPSNATGTIVLMRDDLSPPLAPVSLLPDGEEAFQPIHRRESGRELPWEQPHADDPFATYEAPIQASAGRYLWVTLELIGTTRLSPRVRCLRAESPAHDYLRRLPRTFSRDSVASSFLLRYLSIFEGFLGEVDARSAERATLLEPRATPDEALPWLASFMGLVLDERWTVDQRRTLVAEIADLWRRRGTVGGLVRLLEIYLGVAPIVIERFRMRGVGGAILGIDQPPIASSVVGVDFRLGGAVGTADGQPLTAKAIEDAFRTHAHRFTVVIPRLLSDQQRSVVVDVLEAHRPAHTLYNLCTVAAGVRIGVALHLGMSSILGKSSDFEPALLGASTLGGGAILGRPAVGTTPSVNRLGYGTRVG